MSNENKPKKFKKRYKKPIKFQTIALFVGCITSILMLLAQAIQTTLPAKGDLPYAMFVQMLENGEITKADFTHSQDAVKITTIDGNTFSIIDPDYEDFKKELLENGVTIDIKQRTLEEALVSVLTSIPMTVILFVFLWYILRSVGGQTTTLFKVLKPEDIITFNDVAGMSETKAEVEFAVSQIKNRVKLKELGARPCKGIILEGPPGTGKTLLAKAIAGEAGVPFISTSGADFIEMFVGLGAARVRALWDLALTNAPCVVFIDEIDAVGKRRSGYGDGASTEGNQTLNALLQRMDGLGIGDGIFVVAATNRISDLDPALLRPGRFDKRLFIGPPKSKKDRDEVIAVHMRGKKTAENYDADAASKLMFGLSGAEIEQVLNEAVMISVQENRDGVISLSDVDKATMKLRASGVATTHTSEQDKVVSAVHEAGHAIINLALGRKVSKVSVMPYSSGVGGMTIMDTDDMEGKKLKTKNDLLSDIKVLLAGRSAEKLIFGDTSIGCSNDIERATTIAFQIINNFAMDSDNIVNMTALVQSGVHILDSESIANRVNSILKDCERDIDDILKKYEHCVIALKDKLLSEETLIDIGDEWLNIEVVNSNQE